MKLIGNQFWNDNQTNIAKYFVEKLLQNVDSQEIITYQHSTSNGHTIIAELLKQSNATLQREKSGYRLTSLIREAVDRNSKSNIIGDLIIKKYHKDIFDFFNKYKVENRSYKDKYELINIKHSDASQKLLVKRDLLVNFRNKMEVFNSRLDNYYLSNLKHFAKTNINLSDDTKFKRNADKIDAFIHSLIPSLLKIGYSPTSIRDVVVYVLPKQDSSYIIEKFLNIFHGYPSGVDFKLVFKKNNSLFKFYCDFVQSPPIFKEIKSKNKDYREFHLNQLQVIDRNTYLNTRFLALYKDFIFRNHSNTNNLNYSDFFERISSRTSLRGKDEDKPYTTTLSRDNMDPLNVNARQSTLIYTINEIHNSDKVDTVQDPRLAELLYNYSLALSTQSIEVSMSVLWTILESLTTYRYRSSDIANVQYFVSKFLCIGAIGRDIRAFASRLFVNNSLTQGKLDKLQVFNFGAVQSTYGLENWTKFLVQDFAPKEDPYTLLNEVSPLLCNQFCVLNDTFKDKKLVTWLNRIIYSKVSIEFQLERVYSYRNQVVHTGKTVSEYSNLWTHLEWYVGKLLSYLYNDFIKNPSNFDMASSFKQLEGDCDYIFNYLVENKDNKIKDSEHFYSSLFRHSWMTY